MENENLPAENDEQKPLDNTEPALAGVSSKEQVVNSPKMPREAMVTLPCTE